MTTKSKKKVDFEAKYREEYRANVRNAPSEAKVGEFDEKVRNFCDLHGFEEDDVVNEIKKGGIVTALFAKDPKTQNFYERIAGNYIRQLKCVSEFESRTNDDSCHKFILTTSGEVSSLKTQKNEDDLWIDFKWVYKGFNFYAQHTYTKESGGSQNTRFDKIKTFIESAKASTLDNTCFIAIVDGPYFELHGVGQVNVSRLEELQNLSNKSTVFACTIEELETTMQAFGERNT